MDEQNQTNSQNVSASDSAQAYPQDAKTLQEQARQIRKEREERRKRVKIEVIKAEFDIIKTKCQSLILAFAILGGSWAFGLLELSGAAGVIFAIIIIAIIAGIAFYMRKLNNKSNELRDL